MALAASPCARKCPQREPLPGTLPHEPLTPLARVAADVVTQIDALGFTLVRQPEDLGDDVAASHHESRPALSQRAV